MTDSVLPALDPRLKAAIEAANYRISFNTQCEALKVRLQHDLTHFISGGSFNITHELIGFVFAMKNCEYDSIILVDANDNPIRVDNIGAFYDEIVAKYFEATNQYHTDLNKLKRTRGR